MGWWFYLNEVPHSTQWGDHVQFAEKNKWRGINRHKFTVIDQIVSNWQYDNQIWKVKKMNKNKGVEYEKMVCFEKEVGISKIESRTSHAIPLLLAKRWVEDVCSFEFSRDLSLKEKYLTIGPSIPADKNKWPISVIREILFDSSRAAFISVVNMEGSYIHRANN